NFMHGQLSSFASLFCFRSPLLLVSSPSHMAFSPKHFFLAGVVEGYHVKDSWATESRFRTLGCTNCTSGMTMDSQITPRECEFCGMQRRMAIALLASKMCI
ncbi:hypothetical protein BDA99DRAFT_509249, partial [Phascolomyces articulosus]